MKPFTHIAVVVFALVALVHLLRLFMAWPVSIDGVAVPVWVSAIGFVGALVLAVMVWRERGQ
jgi:hypothetical protein